MNLFEGLQRDSARTQNPEGFRAQSNGLAARCWCCAQGLLLLCPGDADGACIVQLALAATDSPADSHDAVCHLRAHVEQLGQPDQLLGACAAQCCSLLQPAHPASSLLALCQHKSSLKLYNVTAASTSQQSCMQLLGEFEHEGLAGVGPCSCTVLPSPAVLLQPEPWQLLVIQPAVQLPRATAPPPAADGGLCAACAGAPDSPAWQASDLALPAAALLEAVAHSFPSTQEQLVAICCNNDNGTRQAGNLVAAAPWVLLHSSCNQYQAAGQLQLLLALPIASTGAKQQQQAVLLCMLHVGLLHAGSTAAGTETMHMAWCHALDWAAAPSSAAVFERSDSWARDSCSSCAQYVAVGSQDGALQMLTSSSGGSWCVLAAAQLPGAIHFIEHIPQAYLVGASHHDVLAVLHDQHAAGTSTSTRRQGQAGGMAVSLLKLQRDGNLQELAVVQGVLGLCAPSQSPLGLLCPQQSVHREQQGLGRAAHTDHQGVRLAAVIMLDSSMSGKPLGEEAARGLGSYAWLNTADGDLPEPLLGILAAPRAAAQHVSGMPAAAHSSAVGACMVASSAAGADNELSGLRSMLAVLEQRWQQGTRDLCSLQQRVMTAQRLVAAGHEQLCQMAADTLYHSYVRQHVLPLSSMQPGAALAVYHAGWQLAEKQQHAAEQAVQGPLTTQLQLQVLNISTRLQNRHLYVQVCLRPELQCMRAPGGQAIKWCGALLQPCHAELLLWHAGTAGVTTSSTWSWDAISGQLTVTLSVSIDLLLQLRSLRSSKQGTAQGLDASAQAAAAHAQAKQLQDGHEGVAQALATAAQRVAGGMASDATSSTSRGSHAADAWTAIELHAAVAVSACCSNQAVVQWQARQQSQQLQTVSDRVLQRAQLLEPALVLLHLEPLRIPAQDLLVYQLTGIAPGRHAGPQPVPPAAGAGAQAGAQAAAQTPLRPSAAGRMVQHGRRSSIGLGAGMPDVVPPTPCSADESDGEPGVIPDSQEDDYEQQQGPHEKRQELQQWWQSQQQRQLPVGSPEPDEAHGAAAAGADGMDWEAAKDANKGHEQSMRVQVGALMPAMPSAGKCRQMLLQSATVDLQLLTTALQRMQCFRCASSTSQHQRLVLQAGVRQAQQRGDAGGMDQGALDFLFLGAHALLVTITASCQHSLERMEQLLLLAVRQLPGGTMVQGSMLSPFVLGSLASATKSLADVTHLHVKVLEDTLQQLPASMTRLSQQHKPAGSATDPSPAANVSKQLQPAVSGGARLVVDGAHSSSMAECWLGCLKAQADADLAVQVLNCLR